MATFYLLPPRACLERLLSDVVSRLLPGLPVPADGWDVLLLHLAQRSGWTDDLFLVPRDDLPPDEPVAESLRNHFGAEPGDRVVEVALPRGHWSGAPGGRSWTVEPLAVSAAAGEPYNRIAPDRYPSAIGAAP